MKIADSSIMESLQRRFSMRIDGLWSKGPGVHIEDRRWRRAFDALDRECETLRRRMIRQGRRGGLD
jgi:hypothetical protein